MLVNGFTEKVDSLLLLKESGADCYDMVKRTVKANVKAAAKHERGRAEKVLLKQLRGTSCYAVCVREAVVDLAEYLPEDFGVFEEDEYMMMMQGSSSLTVDREPLPPNHFELLLDRTTIRHPSKSYTIVKSIRNSVQQVVIYGKALEALLQSESIRKNRSFAIGEQSSSQNSSNNSMEGGDSSIDDNRDTDSDPMEISSSPKARSNINLESPSKEKKKFTLTKRDSHSNIMTAGDMKKNNHVKTKTSSRLSQVFSGSPLLRKKIQKKLSFGARRDDQVHANSLVMPQIISFLVHIGALQKTLGRIRIDNQILPSALNFDTLLAAQQHAFCKTLEVAGNSLLSLASQDPSRPELVALVREMYKISAVVVSRILVVLNYDREAIQFYRKKNKMKKSPRRRNNDLNLTPTTETNNPNRPNKVNLNQMGLDQHKNGKESSDSSKENSNNSPVSNFPRMSSDVRTTTIEDESDEDS